MLYRKFQFSTIVSSESGDLSVRHIFKVQIFIEI